MLKHVVLGAIAALSLAACGPPKPGFGANYIKGYAVCGSLAEIEKVAMAEKAGILDKSGLNAQGDCTRMRLDEFATLNRQVIRRDGYIFRHVTVLSKETGDFDLWTYTATGSASG